MSMTYYDGMDWYGDNEQDSVTILAELNSRGWVPRGNVTAQVLDPSPIWSGDSRYQPTGKAIKLGGPVGGYIMHSCKPWIDTAVGLNIRFDVIPSGGPYKIIEIVQWNGGYNVLYTLALLNGRLYSYSYGDVQTGSPLQDGTTFFMGALSAGQTYSLHYYGRRSLRILWVDGRIQGYWGGYSGLASNHIVRIHNTGRPTIDDVYFTHTQPERWPGALDTLLCYDYLDGSTLYRHKVLTPMAEGEVESEWEASSSLVPGIKGSNSNYVWVDATLKREFAAHHEDVAFPCPPLYNYHVQGACCAEREGSVRNSVGIEGRYPGYDSGAAIPDAVAWWVHNDTVALGTDPMAPSPRDFKRLVNKPLNMALNRQLTSTPEELNKIDWWGRTWERPAIFGASF